MPKALFLSLPLHGHTNPTLPVVRALVERGEEVTYYSAAAFALKVRRGRRALSAERKRVPREYLEPAEASKSFRGG